MGCVRGPISATDVIPLSGARSICYLHNEYPFMGLK